MAIVLKSVKYPKIILDSKAIIGVMGNNYPEFLKSIQGEEVFYLGLKNIDNKRKVLDYLPSTDFIDEHLKDLDLEKPFLEKRVSDLSHSEKRLLKYLVMLSSCAQIIVVDEPFVELDYHYKKTLIALFNRLSKNKTIIIGSKNSDVIYEICKKVLLLGKDDYLYKETTILANKNILKKYHIKMPQILEFIRLANDKKNHLSYTQDIRDLIKDVYKNVTK